MAIPHPRDTPASGCLELTGLSRQGTGYEHTKVTRQTLPDVPLFVSFVLSLLKRRMRWGWLVWGRRAVGCRCFGVNLYEYTKVTKGLCPPRLGWLLSFLSLVRESPWRWTDCLDLTISPKRAMCAVIANR